MRVNFKQTRLYENRMEANKVCDQQERKHDAS